MGTERTWMLLLSKPLVMPTLAALWQVMELASSAFLPADRRGEPEQMYLGAVALARRTRLTVV